MHMIRHNYYILTGAPGAGKSALLKLLLDRGLHGIDEPGRRVLAEQRRVNESGVPGKDNRQFVDLMLMKAIEDYKAAAALEGKVLFDRGIPDNLAYAAHFGFDHPDAEKAAGDFRYNGAVFFFPSWEAIYTRDEERIISFEVACSFGERLRAVYRNLGYHMIDVPCVPVEERLQFILCRLAENGSDNPT